MSTKSNINLFECHSCRHIVELFRFARRVFAERFPIKKTRCITSPMKNLAPLQIATKAAASSSENHVQQQQATQILPTTTTTTTTTNNDNFDVDYIFFSEFDIDKGAIVRMQYPKLFPHLMETELSAQMLPDGSHNCQEDATVILARTRRSNENEPPTPLNESMIEEDVDLYYGLNMYKQKKYENIKRGARVKAIAVLSKSKRCLALRPLLSQALEIIFQISDHAKNQRSDDSEEEMSDQMVYDKMTAQLLDFFEYLYNYINSIDLSQVPTYTETQKIVWRYCLRKYTPLYSTIVTTLSYAPTNGYAIPEEKKITLRIPTHLLENEISIIFDKKQGSRLSLLPPKVEKKRHRRRMSFSKEQPTLTTASKEAALELKRRKEVNDGTKASLINLITVFGEKTMMIFNAILYGKSIIFCGVNKNAGFINQFVLASLLLLPTLPNVLSERVFPYVSFMNMDWLNERDNGFIVGVTNPIFASRDEYFDFLCDIDSGKVVVSSQEKTRLHQKQMVSSSKKTRIKSVRNHRHRRHASISDDFIPEEVLPNDDLKQRRSSTPISGSNTPDTLGGEGFGVGMGLISDSVTGALSSDSTTGIVQSITVKVAENDDVCHMTTKDADFIRKVIDLIVKSQEKKVPRSETEELVRGHFFDYSTSILELAFDMRQRILFQKKQYYRSVSSSYERKLTEDNDPDENVLKTFTWRQANSFKLYSDKRAEQAKRCLIPLEALDIPLGITMLTQNASLDEEEIISFFQKVLRAAKTRDELLEFLSYFPESRGGINAIIYPLFHSSPAVRIVVVALLRRLERESLLINLNQFMMITYQRNLASLPDTLVY